MGSDIKLDEKVALIKEAEQYSIAIYDHQFQRLKEEGAIYLIGEGEAWILHEKYYDDSIGFVMDPSELNLKNQIISH